MVKHTQKEQGGAERSKKAARVTIEIKTRAPKSDEVLTNIAHHQLYKTKINHQKVQRNTVRN